MKKYKIMHKVGVFTALLCFPVTTIPLLVACSSVESKNQNNNYNNGWNSNINKKGFSVSGTSKNKNDFLKLDLSLTSWHSINKYSNINDIVDIYFKNNENEILKELKSYLMDQNVVLTITDAPNISNDHDVLYTINVQKNEVVTKLFFNIIGFGIDLPNDDELEQLDIDWKNDGLGNGFSKKDKVLFLDLSNFDKTSWNNLDKYASIQTVINIVESNWNQLNHELKQYLTDDSVDLNLIKYILDDDQTQNKNSVFWLLEAKKNYTTAVQLGFVISGFGNSRPIDPNFSPQDYLNQMAKNSFVYDKTPIRQFLKSNVSDGNNLGFRLAQFIMDINKNSNNGYNIDYIFDTFNNIIFKNVEKEPFKKVIQYIEFKVIDFTDSFLRIEVDYNFEDGIFLDFYNRKHPRKTVEYHLDITDWKNDSELMVLDDELDGGYWEVLKPDYLSSQSLSVTSTIPNIDIFNTKNIENEKTKINDLLKKIASEKWGQYWTEDFAFQEMLLQGLLFLKTNFFNDIDNIKVFRTYKKDLLFTGIINKNNVVKSQYINNFGLTFPAKTFNKNDVVYLMMEKKTGPLSDPSFKEFKKNYEHLDNSGRKVLFENAPIFEYKNINKIQFMEQEYDTSSGLNIPLVNFWYDFQEVKSDSGWLKTSAKTNFEFHNELLPLKRYALGTHSDFGMNGFLNMERVFFSDSDNVTNSDIIKDGHFESANETQKYVRFMIQQNYGHIMDKMVLYLSKNADNSITISAQVKIKDAGKVFHKFAYISSLQTKVFDYKPNDIVYLDFTFNNRKIDPSSVALGNAEFNQTKLSVNNYYDYADYDIFSNYFSKDRVTSTQFTQLQPLISSNWKVIRNNAVVSSVLNNFQANTFASPALTKVLNYVYYA